MTAAEFLATSEAQRVLDRAAVIAGIPVSVHAYTDGAEDARRWGCGGCAACAYVNALQWGGQFCRRSRSQAAASARSRLRPVPFLCHMRFPCVAVPAVHDDPDAGMITFGPYCPAEAPGSLAGEALECLPNVAQTSFDALPFSVDDIPLAASAAIFSIAEWTAETLTQQFRALVAFEDIAEPAESIEPATPPPGGRHYPRAVRDPFQSADLLAALVSGDADRFRRLVAIVLDERGGPQRQSVALARGRALAMTGAILEAAERAGFSTGKVWSVMDELPNRLAESNDADAIAKIIRDSLRGLRGADRQTSPSPDDFGALFRFISDHMADGVTLEEAANAVNESPAAISKRLQRKLGMSFSEYKGRVRVDHAKELLRDTQLSIGEISHRVGIEDLSNFSRLFRQHEGIAPGRYRSKYGRRK